MKPLREALDDILTIAGTLNPVKTSLPESLGLVLAEDIASDIDSPPHDKAMVDGYAVQAADLASGTAILTILEEVTAGRLPTKVVTSGMATRIMTGAPIPDGADAVVMVEETSLDGLDRVRIETTPPDPGKHIMRRGVSLKRGDVVLRSGKILRQIEIGLLAEVGRAHVQVFPRPRVAVLSTGDELVAPEETPGQGQIRNSNGPLLVAAIVRAGGTPLDLGIARDERGDLSNRITAGLSADMLLLSGGVSAGVLDLVPSVLQELGVEQVFHKVAIKPGKPVWFGSRVQPGDSTLVFGLPGNPVSSLVTFELLVRPAIALMSGRRAEGLNEQHATLTAPFQQRGERTTFHPARLREQDGRIQATPLTWKGSADLRTLAEADGWIEFPSGDREFQTGDEVTVLRI